MKARAIDFVVSHVTDIARSKAFYRDVLGIEDPIIEETGSWLEFDTKPVAFALIQLGEAPRTSIALAVDDVHTAVEELRAKGVTIAMEPTETPDCIMAVILDPDGNPVIVHRRHDGTAG